MKKILFSIVASGLLSAYSFSTSAVSDTTKQIEIGGKKYDYVIATASHGGGYYLAGEKLSKLLKNSLNAETDGTLQNLDLISDGKVNIAFVQGDILLKWCNSHKSECSDLIFFRTDNKEYVQILTANRDIEDDSDLQDESVKIYVGSPNSGANGTWEVMGLLESGFKKAKKVTGDGLDESVIFLVKSGKITALMRVSSQLNDKFVKTAIKSGLRFIDVEDWDLNDAIEKDGAKFKFYSFDDFKVQYPSDFFKTKVKSIFTNTFIVVNKSIMSRKQLNKVLSTLNRIGGALWN